MARKLKQRMGGTVDAKRSMRFSKKNSGSDHKKMIIGVCCGVVLAVAMPTLAEGESDQTSTSTSTSQAGNTPLTDSSNAESYGALVTAGGDLGNQAALAAAAAADNTTVAEIASDCAQNGLGLVAAESIQARSILYGTPTNIDELFSVAKDKGCFSALSDLPDLSVSIPTFTGILNSVASTMIKYATKKVCNVVNDSVTKAFAPINDTMKKIEKYSTFDGAEFINSEISKELYSFDPSAMIDQVPISEQTTYTVNSNSASVTNSDGSSTTVNSDGTSSKYAPSSSRTPTAESKTAPATPISNAVTNLRNIFS